jgi:hypothetical protein
MMLLGVLALTFLIGLLMDRAEQADERHRAEALRKPNHG